MPIRYIVSGNTLPTTLGAGSSIGIVPISRSTTGQPPASGGSLRFSLDDADGVYVRKIIILFVDTAGCNAVGKSPNLPINVPMAQLSHRCRRSLSVRLV